MDPILLPLLSTERLDLLSGVPALSRVAKTAIVAENPDARRMLDVCIANADKRMRLGKINCSNCWKCVRTLLTLEALGQLDAFGEVFDLAYYRANRTALMHSLVKRSGQGDVAAKEALAFARARGLPLPGPMSRIGRRTAHLRRRAVRRSLQLLGARAISNRTESSDG